MILSSVYLKNFRSHKSTSINFSEKINYIVGGNGQGKTSVLESIYFLCTTKGYNSKSDIEVTRFNEKGFEIKGSFKDLTENDIRVYFSLEENRKYYFQNGKLINRLSDVIGKFPVVILTPADHSITQGSPGDRRKFVDSVISQSSETYLKLLLDLNRTLRQRSSLLTRIKEKNSRSQIMYNELDAWTLKLIDIGTEIINHRIKFINEFNPYINESYKRIMGNDEIPKVTYSFLEGKKEYENRNMIKEDFHEIINTKREEELRRATNLVGPQRDEYLFEINSMELKTFGSQGQHKTFQIALKFAQFFYLKEKTGKTPVFLLDDVFGELDANRSLKTSEYLRETGQAFITLTDFSNMSFLKIKEKDTLIRLKQGEVVYA
ncbi:MAG: DNA replication and repair protein RecF [Ignavibacteriaceae bacterium]